MELAIAFIAGVLVLMALAENEKLEDMRDKDWVNYLADQSRKGKPAGVRKRSRYTVAGWMPGRSRK